MMNSIMFPPPIPPEYEEIPRPVVPKKPMSYRRKIFFMVLQGMVLAFALGMIFALVYDREYKNGEVAESIAREWGGPVNFNGILIKGDAKGAEPVFPDVYDCYVKVDTKTLHRGIYEAEVFDADFTVSGTVSRSKLAGASSVTFRLEYDPENISSVKNLTVGGRSYAWSRGDDHLEVKVPFSSLPEKFDFKMSFATRGSEGVYVAQIGDRNKIKIDGKASNPSFQGRSLPLSRTIGRERFDASWENEGIPRDQRRISRPVYDPVYPGEMPEEKIDPVETVTVVDADGNVTTEVVETETDEVVEAPAVPDSSAWVMDDAPEVPLGDYSYNGMNDDAVVGAEFLVGVDRYQKVTRTLKYSFIIIVLTYLAVLLVEVICRRRIPLLNYFLIGVALVLFYTLLLSFVELMGFGWSYLIAAVMTVALITGYMWKILDSRKLGLTMLGILAGLYGAIYVMLSLATLALLLGSLILFVALSACMYASIKFNKQKSQIQ